VLFFEFLPSVFERFNLNAPIKWIKKVYPVLIVLGILLSTLHQSSLGSLYLIMPSKLHPFWYSPALPFFFFGSAVAVGLAMTIFESTQSAKALGRHLELSVLVRLGGTLLVALWVNALLRFEDFFHRGLLRQILQPSYEAYFLAGTGADVCDPDNDAQLQESAAFAELALSRVGHKSVWLHH
jgi:Ni/Fe-hydrogenase subunit HybB-like protein